MPRVRWAKYLFGLMLLLAVGLLLTDLGDAREVVQHSAESALWGILIAVSVVNERRLDGYRGLADSA